ASGRRTGLLVRVNSKAVTDCETPPVSRVEIPYVVCRVAVPRHRVSRDVTASESGNEHESEQAPPEVCDVTTLSKRVRNPKPAPVATPGATKDLQAAAFDWRDGFAAGYQPVVAGACVQAAVAAACVYGHGFDPPRRGGCRQRGTRGVLQSHV